MKPCPSLAELPKAVGKSGWPWTVETPQMPETMPDGKAWPRISIVTPSYNQGRYIEETIRSILLQGYPTLEYIIMDGGSTDQTVAIIRKYQRWLTYWVSGPDGGQTDAINKGFARTTGEILNWINSDDRLEPNALRRIGSAFAAADDDVGAVVGMANFAYPDGTLSPCNFPAEFSRASLFKWTLAPVWFMQPACFFTKDAWQFAGPLPTSLHYCMDVALWIKIAERFRFESIPELIAQALQHPASKTVAQKAKSHGEVALFLATQPDGFETAQAVLKSVIEDDFAEMTERELAAQTAFELLNRLARRVAKSMGLGRIRHLR
jgi:hypothetical protein